MPSRRAVDGFARRITGGAWVACLALLFGACASAPQSEATAALEAQLAGEVARYVEADAATPPAPCQVLFVGSSSIRLWRTLAIDMAPLPVVNRGFGGSQIEYVNRWFDPLVAANRPRTIVFYAGENDIDAGKSVARVLADFDAFMKLKTAALGDVPVYFIALKPSMQRVAQLAAQGEVNAAVRALAGRRADLHFIDVATPMLDGGQPKDLFAADGLHMTQEGYAIWTREVRAALLGAAQATHQAGSCQPIT
jgi:hypothetical protein